MAESGRERTGGGAGAAKAWTRRVLDALYPPSCLACEEPISEFGALCAACWRDTPFLEGRVCDRCGAGLRADEAASEVDWGRDDAPLEAGQERAVCRACAASPPPWGRARMAARHAGAARGLALALKHGDQTHLAGPMGAWMARAGRPLFEPSKSGARPWLAPIPLHWTRRLKRRYNQSSLLALAIARETGAPTALSALRRLRATPPQVGRDRAERRANVEGAFALRSAWRSRLAGARVILVDDVATTGATLAAASEALLAGGVGEVDALVFARAGRDDDL